jgi:hypothetical protein
VKSRMLSASKSCHALFFSSLFDKIIVADPDPDADPDPAPACHFDADPDSSFQIKTQNLEKELK